MLGAILDVVLLLFDIPEAVDWSAADDDGPGNGLKRGGAVATCVVAAIIT